MTIPTPRQSTKRFLLTNGDVLLFTVVPFGKQAATSFGCVAVFWGSVEGTKKFNAVFFENVWTHKYLAYELGVLGYHVYDLVSTLNEALSPTEISEEEIEKVRRWFDQRLAED